MSEAAAAAAATEMKGESDDHSVSTEYNVEPHLLEAVKRDDPTEAVLSDVKENADGFNCLHLAARMGALRCMNRMIEEGADVNAADEQGNCPVHHAAFGGEVSTMLFLVSKHANVNVMNEEGETPLTIAIMGRHKELTTFLVEYEETDIRANEHLVTMHVYSPLTAAIASNDLELMRACIRRGSTLNPPKRFNEVPPLHFAVKLSNKEAVELLVRSGASVDGHDSKGNTARDIASSKMNKYLLSLGGLYSSQVGYKLSKREGPKTPYAKSLRKAAKMRTELEETMRK